MRSVIPEMTLLGSTHRARTSLAGALAFAAILLLSLLTPVTFIATNRLESYNAAIDRTYNAAQNLSDLSADLAGLEAMQQGFLLTSDAGYRSKLLAAKSRVMETLAREKSILVSDPAIRCRLQPITQSVAERLDATPAFAITKEGAPQIHETRSAVRGEEAARMQIAQTRAALSSFLAIQMADVTARSDQSQILVSADAALVIVVLFLMIVIFRADHSAQVRHYIMIVEEQKRNLERANRELSELAKRDGLTGLINHRTFHEHLVNEFLAISRQDESISLLMIDVDHFKHYNDAYGHQGGDAVLSRIARILADTGRTSDVVARYGGEEFAILLPTTGLRGARDLAERLRQRVEDDAREHDGVTISIGVAATTRDGCAPTELVAMADSALYRSKARGRNQVTVGGGITYSRGNRYAVKQVA